MLNYRLKVKLDYYYKLTSSLIYSVPLPETILLVNKRTENAMEVSNEGIELELEADILRGRPYKLANEIQCFTKLESL